MAEGRRRARSPRPAHHRIARLDGWSRWAVIATIAVFGAIPLATAARTLQDGWVATGDVATIGLRSRDAWTSQAPLLGQPTTGQERSGVPSNHPGPLENWLLGPGMHLFGASIGLLAGVALVNGAALAATTWLAFRRGGPALLAIVAVLLALMIWGLGGATLFDAFNSELPTYPLLAAALGAWCVLVGDLRVAPVFVVFGSIAAQAHVAVAPLVAALVVVVAGSLVLQWRRRPAAVRAQRPWLLGALGAGLACWLPPLVQELTGTSNLGALWRTRGAEGPQLGVAFVVERLITAVAPVPLFAHPTSTYGFLAEQGTWGVLAAALVLGGGASLALHQRLAHGRRSASLLCVVLAAVIAGVLVGWPGAPPISAFRSDSFRWPWIVGLLAWLALLWPAWLLLPARAREHGRRAAPAVAALVAVVLGGWSVAATDPGELRDARFQDAVASLSDQLRDELPAGPYHLTFDGADAVITIGPGLALQLEDHGSSVSVTDDGFGRAFGDARTGRRPGDLAELRVLTGDAEVPAGARVVADAPYVAGDGTPARAVVVEVGP